MATGMAALRCAFSFALIVLVSGLGLLTAPAAANAAQYSGYVLDAKTGKVLYSHRGDAAAYPASLTKMMTLYMLFEAMDAGKVRKSSRITISARAASMQPSKLGIKAGGSVTAEQAILALVTKSANDVACAVGEFIGGSESNFASMMTRKARQLGMSNTTFKNASGLPNSAQKTTAHDMAILGVALREHFPQYYDYFSTRSFTYGKKRMGNHNRLLGKVRGMDGIKTGYTRASGYNLVSSVERDGRSIVAVVMGGSSGKSRNAQMVAIIDKYLPKASKGRDKMLVARKGGVPVVVASAASLPVAKLPRKGPLPAYREENDDPSEQRIVMAHATATAAESFDVAAIERKLLELSGKALPVPTPSPSARTIDPTRTASVAPARSLRPAEPVGQRAVPEGWQIQIGATDSEQSAESLLSKARAKAPRLLKAFSNYTETVEKNGDVLYRARFAGFSSKSAAWDACGQLKKQKFACLAVAN
ncbi:MAG: D-alanyl-D-alanine carboxypeptidase [Nitratireductor sp.]|nr:D-alanyl-D-alanine carboxypeptidase [Nitratireductor sp.]